MPWPFPRASSLSPPRGDVAAFRSVCQTPTHGVAGVPHRPLLRAARPAPRGQPLGEGVRSKVSPEPLVPSTRFPWQRLNRSSGEAAGRRALLLSQRMGLRRPAGHSAPWGPSGPSPHLSGAPPCPRAPSPSPRSCWTQTGPGEPSPSEGHRAGAALPLPASRPPWAGRAHTQSSPHGAETRRRLQRSERGTRRKRVGFTVTPQSATERKRERYSR